MTETLDPMDQTKIDHQKLAQQLLAQANADGVELVGPNGLLNQLTANVLETALEAEMEEHLGYEKHQVEGRNGGNSRNGRRAKTVLTEIGPVEIQVPRDTDASFDPQIVKKRQRRLTGVDEIILSLSSKGLTTGEIVAHFDDVFPRRREVPPGASVSRETISKISPSTACREVGSDRGARGHGDGLDGPASRCLVRHEGVFSGRGGGPERKRVAEDDR